MIDKYFVRILALLGTLTGSHSWSGTCPEGYISQEAFLDKLGLIHVQRMIHGSMYQIWYI